MHATQKGRKVHRSTTRRMTRLLAVIAMGITLASASWPVVKPRSESGDVVAFLLPLKCELWEGDQRFDLRCLSAEEQLQVAFRPTTLTGLVLDAETEQALPGSGVTVGPRQVLADPEGKFTAGGVRPGWPIQAAAPGYVPTSAVFAGESQKRLYLDPTQTPIVVWDAYTNQPLPGAAVAQGRRTLLTDNSGQTVASRLVAGDLLSVRAVGYAATEVRYQEETAVHVPLRPNTLSGTVRDAREDALLAGALVRAVTSGQVLASAVTDAAGQFALPDIPESLTLEVTAPGHERRELHVERVTQADVRLEPFVVRGIYCPLGLLTVEERVQGLLDLIDRTELNTLVVDMKNDLGWIGYPSQVPEAEPASLYLSQFMDIHGLLATCREKGIYTIARIVLFKDPIFARAFPAWAVHNKEGEIWIDSEGSAWGDPFREEVRDYNAAIAREIAALGFDELQFDYVRFPSDGDTSNTRYAEKSTLESRTATIREFCARLQRELKPLGVVLSADLFGLTTWVDPETDMGIGQRVVDIAPYMDYLSPMLYPATFIKGNLGYEEPLLHPYAVVYRSVAELAGRSAARVRPWLQHYSSQGVTYGPKDVRLQIEAAQDAGSYGWMCWHAAGKYDENSFLP